MPKILNMWIAIMLLFLGNVAAQSSISIRERTPIETPNSITSEIEDRAAFIRIRDSLYREIAENRVYTRFKALDPLLFPQKQSI